MASLKKRFLFILSREKNIWKTRLVWGFFVGFFLLLVALGWGRFFVFKTLLIFHRYCCKHIFLWLT